MKLHPPVALILISTVVGAILEFLVDHLLH